MIIKRTVYKLQNICKHLIALMLSVSMLFGLSLFEIDVNAATNGITQKQAVEWAQNQASNPKDYDGVYGVQCVDLIVAYYKYLGERSPGGNGRDYATNTLPTGWKRIQYSNGFVPLPGDIAVWTKTGSVYGHVAIVLSANTSSVKVSEFLGSNHTARTHTYKYSYGTFYGVIRPDFSGGSSSDYSTGDIIDFSGTFKVMCSSKSVKSSPYGSSSTTRTVYRDNQLKVVGYVYNSYGNLWYKTDKGDYIHPTYLYAIDYNELPPSNYCNAQFEVKCTSKALKGDPKSSSDTLKTYVQGNRVNVTGYVYNEYGNLWYETTDGGYTYCSYLSLISSDERTPSNYLDTQMKVVASSKTLREDPYSSAESKGTVYQNNNVSVKGYLYNRYGNLWYITNNDYYIYSNYLQQINSSSLIPSNYIYANNAVTAEKDYKSEPYAVSDSLDTLASGKLINTIGYVINLFGNKWFECEDGGFIYDSSLAPAYYTVTYNANGGTGAPASQAKTYGQTLTLSSTKPTRTGYSFVGWATSSSATGATYSAGGSYTANASVTLYAVWKANTYTVTYNANGGTAAPASQAKTYGQTLTLSSTKPTRTGYSFVGWATSSSATDATYSAGGSYTANASVTLYAVWKANTYTITYNANGGTGAPSVQTKNAGETITLTSQIPTKTGYNFLAWCDNSEVTGENYIECITGTREGSIFLSGEYYSTDKNITLYAVWEKQSYSISYDANGGSGAPPSQTKYYGTNIALSLTVPTRTGYTFQGWATSSYATSVAYEPGETYTGNSSIILYAVWEAKGYSVLFDANGGSGAPAQQIKIHDQPLTLSSTKPTRSGYTFLGWSTSNSATSAMYQPGDSYTVNSATMLFAVWKEDMFLSSISVYSKPSKTVYYIGDSFNAVGLQLNLIYSDGTSEIISSGFATSGFSSTSDGTKTVTVSYDGLTTTFNVTVNTPTISLSDASKSMTVGDTATLTATSTPSGKTVTWTSSNTDVAAVSNGMITAKSAGSTVITAKFTYNGIVYSKTCTITVEDEPVVLSSISVYAEPNKTVYNIGDEINTSGLELLLTYSDSSTTYITSGFNISGFDSASAGSKTITVGYSGKSTTFNIYVIDGNTPKISVSNASGLEGKTVSLTVSLENNPGIVSATLRVNFDTSVLTLVSVTDAGVLGTTSHKPELTSPYTLVWANDTATQNFMTNGTIVTLTFKIADNAPLGEYPITVSYNYDNYDIYNKDAEKINFIIVNGSISVIDVIIGDVNGDGMINNLDRMFLTRYLADWNGYDETTLDLVAADVNCDGLVNNLDRMVLTRYLADWDGYLELPYIQ